MMGETRKMSAVTSAAPTVGARRIVAGTIGEAAAIARLTASELAPIPSSGPDSFSAPHTDDKRQTIAPSNSAESSSEIEVPAETAPDPGLGRRIRAGAGQLKDSSQPETARTAVHLIMADRAYAYGRHIVGKDKSTKLGDVLAIES